MNYFAGQGVKIISRSETSEYDGAGDGTGPIASVINSAATQGMAFFQAAGNNAGPNPARLRLVLARLVDRRQQQQLPRVSLGDEGMQFLCGTFINGFRWSDWGTRPESDQLRHLRLRQDRRGALTGLLASGTANQQTGAPPIEIPHYSCNPSDPTDTLIVQRVAPGTGSTGDVLEWEQNGLSVEYWQNPYSAGSPAADTASPGGLTVGAIDPPNGTAIAPYSS